MTLKPLLRSIALKYPATLISAQMQDIDRIAFHIRLVQERKGSAIALCDIGGGIGLFSAGCAALGMKPTLIDDFGDEVNVKTGAFVLDLHRSLGVDVISKDVIVDPLPLKPGSLDAITCFESMEHWHNSPKRLFRCLKAALKPGGVFVLSAPNCVDMARRLAIAIGHGQWSTIESWYESETFRGHVREPDVRDLRHIANDIGFTNVKIFGRNWWPNTRFQGSPAKPIASLVAHLLRLRPSLCSTIYLVGYAQG